jgi:hypothetical protein
MATLTLKRKKSDMSFEIIIIKEGLTDLGEKLNKYILYLEEQSIAIEASFIKVLRDNILAINNEINKSDDIDSKQLINLDKIYSLLNIQVKNNSISEKNILVFEDLKNSISDFNKLINLFTNILKNKK